ncbi:NAD-dependent epimerase/dehydratase family protein [Paenarthrobacter sp. 2TAF44]|uniref:NAD-dependent epimerase/dehydratase family protein n=1 Tax=Paenarthrobacter sp. 2TAF44 TaxID=3233018 RepID=UPI003F9CF943
MRILVLGGTAFLSAEMAKQALALGHEVTCLARGTQANPPDGVTWVRGDRALGRAAYEDVNSSWDAVIDVSRDPAQARDALEVLGPPARHWTFVSSCSVYADHSVPGADENAAVLEPLPEGQAGTPDTYGESKSAIEHMTLTRVGQKAHIVRAGLIGGPGDGSDRYGYWPGRFAANTEPVLVPNIPDDATQVIDVRDLARWIIQGAEKGLTGAYNASGDVVPFREYISESCRVALGQERQPDREEWPPLSQTVQADEDWLVEQGVEYWAGPDSLPLWLPADHDGFQSRSNQAAKVLGMTLRPWQETLRDALDYERSLGLERERKAGLSRETERRLVGLLREQRT